MCRDEWKRQEAPERAITAVEEEPINKGDCGAFADGDCTGRPMLPGLVVFDTVAGPSGDTSSLDSNPISLATSRLTLMVRTNSMRIFLSLRPLSTTTSLCGGGMVTYTGIGSPTLKDERGIWTSTRIGSWREWISGEMGSVCACGVYRLV